MEFLEADGLEDAVLVILPGEQDKRQGSRPCPSEQWETPTLPKRAELFAPHSAGTSPGDTSPQLRGQAKPGTHRNTDGCLHCQPTSALEPRNHGKWNPPCRRSRHCHERAESSDTSELPQGVGSGSARVCQVGLGAERELAHHPPVLSHLLSVVASVEVPQLLQQPRSQHVIHPLLQPLVQSWEEESKTRSAVWSHAPNNVLGRGSVPPASQSTRERVLCHGN